MTVLDVASTKRFAATRRRCPALPAQPGTSRTIDVANQDARLMQRLANLQAPVFRSQVSAGSTTALVDGRLNLSAHQLSGILSTPMVLIKSLQATYAVDLRPAVQRCWLSRWRDLAWSESHRSIYDLVKDDCHRVAMQPLGWAYLAGSIYGIFRSMQPTN